MSTTHVTTGMMGGGFYNRNSAPQAMALEYVMSWLLDAAATMDLAPVPEVITAADFGCSEGRNSISVMQKLLAVLRARTDRPLMTVHSDLPTNDFSELLRALRPQGAPIFDHGAVYPTVAGGSMYDQILPPRSVHIAMTFNAIGFLSRRPLDVLPGYILPNGPSALRDVGQVTADETAVFAGQARSDLENFITARASELVPGGKLLIQVFGVGKEHRTCDGLYDVLNDAVLDSVEAAHIDRGVYEAYYQPVYFRGLSELLAPFESDAGAVGDLFSLDRAECYEVPVPFVEEFEKSRDAAAYANAYTNFLRAFTAPVLRLALKEHARADAVVDGVYRKVMELLAEYPERYRFDYVSVAALLTRKN